MKKIFWVLVLLMCNCLMLVPAVHAVEKKNVTRNELQEMQRKIDLLKKEQQQQDQVIISEAERVRALEAKHNKTEKTKLFDPYSYP